MQCACCGDLIVVGKPVALVQVFRISANIVINYIWHFATGAAGIPCKMQPSFFSSFFSLGRNPSWTNPNVKRMHIKRAEQIYYSEQKKNLLKG